MRAFNAIPNQKHRETHKESIFKTKNAKTESENDEMINISDHTSNFLSDAENRTSSKKRVSFQNPQEPAVNLELDNLQETPIEMKPNNSFEASNKFEKSNKRELLSEDVKKLKGVSSFRQKNSCHNLVLTEPSELKESYRIFSSTQPSPSGSLFTQNEKPISFTDYYTDLQPKTNISNLLRISTDKFLRISQSEVTTPNNRFGSVNFSINSDLISQLEKRRHVIEQSESIISKYNKPKSYHRGSATSSNIYKRGSKNLSSSQISDNLSLNQEDNSFEKHFFPMQTDTKAENTSSLNESQLQKSHFESFGKSQEEREIKTISSDIYGESNALEMRRSNLEDVSEIQIETENIETGDSYLLLKKVSQSSTCKNSNIEAIFTETNDIESEKVQVKQKDVFSSTLKNLKSQSIQPMDDETQLKRKNSDNNQKEVESGENTPKSHEMQGDSVLAEVDLYKKTQAKSECETNTLTVLSSTFTKNLRERSSSNLECIEGLPIQNDGRRDSKDTRDSNSDYLNFENFNKARSSTIESWLTREDSHPCINESYQFNYKDHIDDFSLKTKQHPSISIDQDNLLENNEQHENNLLSEKNKKEKSENRMTEDSLNQIEINNETQSKGIRELEKLALIKIENESLNFKEKDYVAKDSNVIDMTPEQQLFVAKINMKSNPVDLIENQATSPSVINKKNNQVLDQNPITFQEEKSTEIKIEGLQSIRGIAHDDELQQVEASKRATSKGDQSEIPCDKKLIDRNVQAKDKSLIDINNKDLLNENLKNVPVISNQTNQESEANDYIITKSNKSLIIDEELKNDNLFSKNNINQDYPVAKDDMSNLDYQHQNLMINYSGKNKEIILEQSQEIGRSKPDFIDVQENFNTSIIDSKNKEFQTQNLYTLQERKDGNYDIQGLLNDSYLLSNSQSKESNSKRETNHGDFKIDETIEIDYDQIEGNFECQSNTLSNYMPLNPENKELVTPDSQKATVIYDQVNKEIHSRGSKAIQSPKTSCDKIEEELLKQEYSSAGVAKSGVGEANSLIAPDLQNIITCFAQSKKELLDCPSIIKEEQAIADVKELNTQNLENLEGISLQYKSRQEEKVESIDQSNKEVAKISYNRFEDMEIKAKDLQKNIETPDSQLNTREANMKTFCPEKIIDKNYQIHSEKKTTESKKNYTLCEIEHLNNELSTEKIQNEIIVSAEKSIQNTYLNKEGTSNLSGEDSGLVIDNLGILPEIMQEKQLIEANNTKINSRIFKEKQTTPQILVEPQNKRCLGGNPISEENIQIKEDKINNVQNESKIIVSTQLKSVEIIINEASGTHNHPKGESIENKLKVQDQSKNYDNKDLMIAMNITQKKEQNNLITIEEKKVFDSQDSTKNVIEIASNKLLETNKKTNSKNIKPNQAFKILNDEKKEESKGFDEKSLEIHLESEKKSPCLKASIFRPNENIHTQFEHSQQKFEADAFQCSNSIFKADMNNKDTPKAKIAEKTSDKVTPLRVALDPLCTSSKFKEMPKDPFNLDTISSLGSADKQGDFNSLKSFGDIEFDQSYHFDFSESINLEVNLENQISPELIQENLIENLTTFLTKCGTLMLRPTQPVEENNDIHLDFISLFNENIGRVASFKKFGNEIAAIKLLKELLEELKVQEKNKKDKEGAEFSKEIDCSENINFKYYKIQICNMLSLELYETGQYQEALDYAKMVLEIDCYNTQALYKSYQINSKLKNEKEAKLILRRFWKITQFQPYSPSYKDIKLDDISIPSQLSSLTNASFYETRKKKSFNSSNFCESQGKSWSKFKFN